MENASKSPDIAANTETQIRIRPVTQSDYYSLEEYLNQFGTKKTGYWLNRFKLWWDANPAYTEDMARGWVLDDMDRIVGFIGAIPMWMRIEGENSIVYGITSWNVTAEYRAFSMELFFTLTRATKNSVLFDTTPSEEVVKILKAFKFKTFASEVRGQSIVPIRVQSLLIAKIKTSRIYQRLAEIGESHRYSSKLVFTALNSLIYLIAAGISPLVKVLINQKLNISPDPNGLVARKEVRVDSALEDLWHRTKDRYLITNVRTTEVLEWNCFSSPSHLKELFVCYEGPLCVGYIIGRVFRREDVDVFECMDIWLDPMHSFALDVLILKIIEHCRRLKVDAIQIPHFSLPLGKKCLSMNLLQRETNKSGWLFKAPKRLNAQMTDLNTYLCRMQGDNGL